MAQMLPFESYREKLVTGVLPSRFFGSRPVTAAGNREMAIHARFPPFISIGVYLLSYAQNSHRGERACFPCGWHITGMEQK